MTAQDAGGSGSAFPPNEKGARTRGAPLNGEMLETTDPIHDVNSEIDRLLRQWLRTGEEFPEASARTRDAARKQRGGI